MRARRLLSDTERTRIEDAIAASERETTGELVVCIATRSGRYDRGEDLFGVFTGMLAVTAAWLLFQDVSTIGWQPSPSLNLVAVLLLFLGGFTIGTAAAAWLPALGLFFTSRRQMLEEVKERAAVAFHRFGMRGTRAATGILIYVSLLERMVWVVGDDAVSEKIPADEWNEMRDMLVNNLRDGRPAEALSQAVERAGALLREHLPGTHDDTDEIRNEIRFLD